jgi:hypothetical protein
VVTGFFLKITGSFQQALLIGSCMVALAACSMWFVVGELKPIPIPQPEGRTGLQPAALA